MAANTAYPPSSSSVATTPTSPATFTHQQIFVSPPSNRRQSVRPGARPHGATVSGGNGIGGSPSSPNILDPPSGLPYADFVAQWQDVHIARWLTDNKCAQYVQAFKDNDIRGDIILELDMDTLKEIGLTSVGDRTRIRNAIKHLRQRCQRPSAGPKLLLNGSPNDVKISTGAGLKLNGDAANNDQETVEPYPTGARGHRRLESVRPPPLQIENVRPRDLPRVERGNGNGSGSTQGPDSARAVSTPRIAQPPPLGAHPRVSNQHGIPSIPPAPKGLPPMPPGVKPRLQVPGSSVLRGARTPTQESTPPPPWTSDPLPPQPVPTSPSPWSKEKEYGLPRKITPGNIGGGAFAVRTMSPSTRGVGVSSIRSPVAHQKQSSFGNTPPALNPKLGGGAAASSHPYASNAGMGISSHTVLTPVQETFTTAVSGGYSVGRGPFPQRGQSVATTTTTGSDDFRRKTLKFHLRDSGSRMIEVKDYDGGSEILERALKKFGVRVNSSDSEYADVDGLHVDGWAVFLGPDADLPSNTLSEGELLAIFHSDPGDPSRENLHLRRIHSPTSYRAPQRQPTSPTTTQYNAEALNTLQANRTAAKKMNRASTVSVLSGLGMQVSSPPTSPGGTALKSPRLGKLRNFFGHRPPSELITTHLQEYFPFTDRKVLNRTARNSVMRKRQTMGLSAGGSPWPPRFASRFSTSTTTSGSGGDADGAASSRNSFVGNSLVEEEEEPPKEKGPHLNLPRMRVETVDGRSVDLTLIDEEVQPPPAATSKKTKRRTQVMLPPVSIDRDSFAEQISQISQNLGASSTSAAGEKDKADKAARRASKRVSKIVELKSREMPNDAGQIPTVDHVTSGIEASRRASHTSLRPTSGIGGVYVEPPSRRASMAEVPIDEEEAVAQQEEEEEEEEEEEDYEEEEEGEEEGEEGEEGEEEDEDEDTLVDTDAPAKITSKATTKTIKWIRGALIGSGSFGNVYLGMDSQRGLLMAVKQVELKGSASDERKKAMLSALEREIDLLKTLQHENIVQYLDSSIDEDNLNIFLEYVPGGSVASLLKNYGAFEESLTINWVRQILRGLEYLHGQTIIHRDIKGANILVDNKGGIKLSDFGVSKKVEDTLPKNHRPSLQGSVFWMAPEVVKQTEYTSKADIWSLGCLIIEMLTGQHPFPEFSQMQAIFRIGSGSARPTIPSDITAEGTDFLQSTFEIDHTLRPSASELAVYAWIAEK